jgi:hypothetical protein
MLSLITFISFSICVIPLFILSKFVVIEFYVITLVINIFPILFVISYGDVQSDVKIFPNIVKVTENDGFVLTSDCTSPYDMTNSIGKIFITNVIT